VRVLPIWESRISSDLLAGRNVLIVRARQQSARAGKKCWTTFREEKIVELNIPTGIPLLYELDAQLQPIESRYLGDPKQSAAAAEAVRTQTEKR